MNMTYMVRLVEDNPTEIFYLLTLVKPKLQFSKRSKTIQVKLPYFKAASESRYLRKWEIQNLQDIISTRNRNYHYSGKSI